MCKASLEPENKEREAEDQNFSDREMCIETYFSKSLLYKSNWQKNDIHKNRSKKNLDDLYEVVAQVQYCRKCISTHH